MKMCVDFDFKCDASLSGVLGNSVGGSTRVASVKSIIVYGVYDDERFEFLDISRALYLYSAISSQRSVSIQITRPASAGLFKYNSALAARYMSPWTARYGAHHVVPPPSGALNLEFDT